MTSPTDTPWGWAGTVREFLGLTVDAWRSALASHHFGLFGSHPSGSQMQAWTDEFAVMQSALQASIQVEPRRTDVWSLVFEYELPLEGGRRPDVVLFCGARMVVLEFKSTSLPTQADIDQVRAYVRDLVDYHSESHDLPTEAIVVLTGATPHWAGKHDGVPLASPEALPHYLDDAELGGVVDLGRWLDGDYHPLPSLVDAARRLFRDEDLPHVKKAIAEGIPEAIDYLGSVVDDAAENGRRVMAFVTGVPGAGKTLVGLRLVYERSASLGTATFLSGNGPLVDVLQDALQSRVFVKDLHGYITRYGLRRTKTPPKEHVVVFDEAQRAWDRDFMAYKKRGDKSEPDLLVSVGEWIPDWAAMIGLVGEGQEIHTGEEAGMGQWADAIGSTHSTEKWTVHCGSRLEETFAGHDVVTNDHLDLKISLRQRRADYLHDWVALVLEGSLALAARKAVHVQRDCFPIFVTRDLEEAREYAYGRFAGEESRRYGLVASSHAKILPKFGVPNDFQATRRLKVAQWYNAPWGDPLSCTALEQPVTEFSCQGLELDLPIVCWGEDIRWQNDAWLMTPINRRYSLEDPHQVLRNVYRVLLTRGREGLVLYVPDDRRMDQTETALLAAGARPLPSAADIVAEVVAS